MRDISSTWIEYIHNVLWIQPTNPFKKPQAVSTDTQCDEKNSEGAFISYESMLSSTICSNINSSYYSCNGWRTAENEKRCFLRKKTVFCRASLFIFVPSLRITALGTLKLQTQRTYTDGHKCAMLNILDHWLLAHSIMFGKTHTSSCLEGNFLRIMSGRTHCNLFGRTTKIAPSKMISTNYLVPKKEGWWWSQPPCSLSTSVG